MDKTSKRNGGELVAQVLKSHEIEHIFTLVGGHISPILAASEKIGIQVVDTRHEVSAVFAADALARLTGKVGVVAVTAGPGLTNTVTAVKNAQMAESPILLIGKVLPGKTYCNLLTIFLLFIKGGAAATILKGRGALQDIDQMSLFKPICKFCATITSIRDIASVLKRAIQVAQSGTPGKKDFCHFCQRNNASMYTSTGPVFVEFPIDVLYPYEIIKKEVGVKDESRGIVNKVVNWYLNNYLDNIFSGAWDPVDVTPLTVDIPLPSSSEGTVH